MRPDFGDEIVLDGKTAKVIGQDSEGNLRLDSGDGNYLMVDFRNLDFVGRAEFKLR